MLQQASLDLAKYVNRRRAPRQEHRSALAVLLLKSSEVTDIRVNTRDVSTEGLAFTSLHNFSKGKLLVFAQTEDSLVCSLRGANRVKLLLAKVRHIRMQPSGFYAVGVQIVESIETETGQENVPLRWLGYKVSNIGFTRGAGHQKVAYE